MSQYKSILKATSIFGGTQILKLLIQLIRTKFVALIIGGAGMGMNAMYMSSLAIFVTIFGMGMYTSVVRDLSKANDECDEVTFSKISFVFKRLLYALSIIGSAFVIGFSNLLSSWSFGDNAHVTEFCFLSLYVLFSLLSQGNEAIITGKRRIKDLALCSLIGSIVTLVTSVPFFYFWGLNGIVPGIIVSTFSSYLVTLFYSKKIELVKVEISWKDVKIYGRSIFVMGLTLTIAALIGNITNFLISIGINKLGGIRDLGYYNAGMSMTGRAISLVFSSLAADYYPRLAASFKEQKRMNETVNEECEIILHISTPILVVFSLCSPLLISLLLSEEFQILNGFIRIICFGMFFKALGYVLGTLSFAKGDKFVYLFFEAGYGNIANIITSLTLYYLYGLKGIAWGFVLCWSMYSILVFFVDRYRYHFSISVLTTKVISINIMFISFISIIELAFSNNQISYYVTGMIALTAIYYNLLSLNRKTGILNVISNKYQNRCKG